MDHLGNRGMRDVGGSPLAWRVVKAAFVIVYIAFGWYIAREFLQDFPAVGLLKALFMGFVFMPLLLAVGLFVFIWPIIYAIVKRI